MHSECLYPRHLLTSYPLGFSVHSPRPPRLGLAIAEVGFELRILLPLLLQCLHKRLYRNLGLRGKPSTFDVSAVTYCLRISL